MTAAEEAEVDKALTERAMTPDEEAEIDAFLASVDAKKIAPPAPVTPDPGLLSTLGHQALSGFFKQGSDEAAGALARAGVDVLPGASYRMPDGTVRKLSGPDDLYRAKRDEVRQTMAAGERERPKLSMLANMAGDVASDSVLGAMGVPVSSNAFQAASGALSGLLGSEAELTGPDASRDTAYSAAASTGAGGAMGYFLPKVGAAISKGVFPAVMPRLRAALEDLAYAQGNRALLSGARTMSNRLPTSREAVMEALRSRALQYFGTTGGAYKRLEDLAFERGAAYGPILEGLEKMGIRGPEADAIAKQLMDEAAERLRVSGADEAIPNLFKEHAETVLKRPDAAFVMPDAGAVGPPMSTLSLTQAEGIKRNLQKAARYGRIEDTPLNEAKKDVASIFRQAIEDTVEEAGLNAPKGSEVAQLAEEFLPIKQNLALTKEAEEAAKWGAARAANRSMIDLPSTVLAAGQDGGPVKQGLAALLFSQARQRGAQTVSRGAYDLAGAAGQLSRPLNASRAGAFAGRMAARQTAASDWLQKLVGEDPDAMGAYGPVLSSALARGPSAFAIQDYVLSQQDPQYRAAKDAAQKSLTQGGSQ